MERSVCIRRRLREGVPEAGPPAAPDPRFAEQGNRTRAARACDFLRYRPG